MNILLVTRLFKPYTGGAATEYNFFFKELVKKKKKKHIYINNF